MRNIAGIIKRLLCVATFFLAGCGSGSEPPPPKGLAAAYADLDHGEPEQAIARVDAAIKSPATSTADRAEAYYIRGRALEAKAGAAGRSGKTADARQHLIWAGDAYVRCIQAKPPQALEGLARAGWANVAFFLDDFSTANREWTAAVPLTTDADHRAWMIYRIGLSRQRMGWFEGADRAFEQVQGEYAQAANGEPAMRAAAARGARAFFVRAAVYTSAAAADREVRELKKQGITAARYDDATGRSVIRVGPIPTFADARTIQSRVAGRHRDAAIEP